jgi:hypothetical protein
MLPAFTPQTDRHRRSTMSPHLLALAVAGAPHRWINVRDAAHCDADRHDRVGHRRERVRASQRHGTTGPAPICRDRKIARTVGWLHADLDVRNTAGDRAHHGRTSCVHGLVAGSISTAGAMGYARKALVSLNDVVSRCVWRQSFIPPSIPAVACAIPSPARMRAPAPAPSIQRTAPRSPAGRSAAPSS